MEFLKHKWGYLFIIMVLAATVMAGLIWIRWKDETITYTDGLLVMNESAPETRMDVCVW